MDEQTMQILLGTVATVASIGLVYAKRTATKKGASEKQVDVILDFVEEFADGLEEKYPDVEELRAFNKHLRKLRRMWDDEEVTTDDILDYLEDVTG
jgi:hypothetical protein